MGYAVIAIILRRQQMSLSNKNKAIRRCACAYGIARLLYTFLVIIQSDNAVGDGDGGQQDECGSDVRRVVQLAQHAVVYAMLKGVEMAVVVNMVDAVLAYRHGTESLRLIVMMKRQGHKHWHIHQQQKPRKP